MGWTWSGLGVVAIGVGSVVGGTRRNTVSANEGGTTSSNSELCSTKDEDNLLSSTPYTRN